MAFVQIVAFRTSKIDEVQALEDKWEADTEGTRTARRSVLCRDRNDPQRYAAVVFFDSYESAMENNNLPATAEFAKRLADVVDGEPTFTDLEVIADRQ
jgi:hypothetical protein